MPMHCTWAALLEADMEEARADYRDILQTLSNLELNDMEQALRFVRLLHRFGEATGGFGAISSNPLFCLLLRQNIDALEKLLKQLAALPER